MSDPNSENAEHLRARNGRNIATALWLVAFVVLVFIVSVIKMGGHGG